MKHLLTEKEARVIGCLLEKEVTTPEQYPLSLNGLTIACNQKTSRDPVMDLSESEVIEIIDSLQKKHWVRTAINTGGRVEKYIHRFCNTEFGSLKFSSAELAIVCLLLLRGPQTPGELKTRAHRMHEFASINDVETTLEHLAQRDDGPFVVKLPREPGRRESRYGHLFSGEVAIHPSLSSAASTSSDSLTHRVQRLEDEVKQLKQAMEALLKQ